MKLHLGCGDKYWEGYVNVDIKGGDVQCDLRKLPFDDESAEEITAIHVVEHFYITEVAGVLREWRRVLKPGGKMILELPCYDKVIYNIKRNADERMTKFALYGDPFTQVDREGALHKWCYSKGEFNRLLQVVKLNGSYEEPHFHHQERDMRWVAIK